jgi:hypothetical protein
VAPDDASTVTVTLVGEVPSLAATLVGAAGGVGNVPAKPPSCMLGALLPEALVATTE